jgi:IS5 family transposase
MPDESTILRFRHRLEKHKLADQILATVNDLLIERGLLLKTGTVVDATLIAAPSSTKTTVKPVTLKCTPAKKATSGTLA